MFNFTTFRTPETMKVFIWECITKPALHTTYLSKLKPSK